jgi:hypothetical protein
LAFRRRTKLEIEMELVEIGGDAEVGGDGGDEGGEALAGFG